MELNMFYYYGRKKQIAKKYPKPIHSTIIEPFAGSAAYSLHENNWQNEIILVEKDIDVYKIWDWLINSATSDEISRMPDLKVGDKSSELLFILHAASKMAFTYKTMTVTPIVATNWEVSKRVMAANVHKIKHWKIINGEYHDVSNVVATWFIDPPYKGPAGTGYRHGSGSLNYDELASWSNARKGQIINCEGPLGDYLPFEPLVDAIGIAGKKNKEMIFHRHN